MLFEANFELLLPCYFFAWAFCLCFFMPFPTMVICTRMIFWTWGLIHTTGQPGLSNVTNIFNNPAHKVKVWAQAHTLPKYVETQNPKRFLVVADCIKNIMRMCKQCLPPPVWSFPDFEDEILPKPCWDGGNTMCQMIFWHFARIITIFGILSELGNSLLLSPPPLNYTPLTPTNPALLFCRYLSQEKCF